MDKKWLVGLGVLLVVTAIGALVWLASHAEANTTTPSTSESAAESTGTQVELQPIATDTTPLQVLEPEEIRPVSPASNMPAPSQTAKPISGSTATLPAAPTLTATPTANALLIDATATVPNCNDRAVDLTSATDIYLGPGESYLFSWILMNDGTCTWTPDYSISWHSGDSLGNTFAVHLDKNVAPGEIVEVPMQLAAPSSDGSFTGQWQWNDPAGNQVAVAPGGRPPFTVTIQVLALPTPTSTPAHGTISGRLLLNGVPAPAGVTLTLEDLSYNPIASLNAGDDGTYHFEAVPESSQGYNLVFSQVANPQFPIDQVLSWGWVGPIPVAAGEVVQLPDFDPALQGFNQINPEPDASIPVATISPATPLSFSWSGHPLASSYWVDLYQGEGQNLVWKSALVSDVRVLFDGVLTDGSPIQPGDYWWGIGARGALGPYPTTIYGYLSAFFIEP